MIRKIVVGIGQILIGLGVTALLFAVLGGIVAGVSWLVGGGLQAVSPGLFGTRDWEETASMAILAIFVPLFLIAILRGAYDAGGEILDAWRSRHYR